MPPPIPLLLLKTKSLPKDPYETHFTTHPFLPSPASPPTPFLPVFIPVLHHHYTNAPALQSIIVSGRLEPSPQRPSPDSCYGALVVTSQRAVEALGAVLEELKGEHTWHSHVSSLFAHTKVYVVGPATAGAMAALGFSATNILGAHCGNGEALAEFILADYDTPAKMLLFLVGETRRDVIPRVLGGAGVGVEEMVIYETAVAGGFKEEFTKAVGETAGGKRWVVVFSPAGADVAVEVLKEHQGGSFVAAIGPTTAKVLTDTLGRRPEVVAGKPSPEGLWEAVTGFMGGA